LTGALIHQTMGFGEYRRSSDPPMNNEFRQGDGDRPVRSSIERLLDDARLRLVETGTRNRLVHTPRRGKRTRSLPIIDADPDDLFESLTRSGRALRFLPSSLERELALEVKADHESSVPLAGAASSALQTNLDEERLEKRLLSIYRDAKTAEEEQGINILFLAIGFLQWYEDDRSEVQRESPLVLLPVSLNRDRPSNFARATRTSPQIRRYRSDCAPTLQLRCLTFQKRMVGVPRTTSLR
jgi:hypothetical protein